MEWTTVEVPKELHRRIKWKAKKTGRKINFLVYEALSDAFPPEEIQKTAA